MKPLYLEFQAFGPYKNREKINFEELANYGLFLVKGPTGSGKTTIFDAMTFALYGGGSGTDSKSKTGRNDLEEWRCNQAEDSVNTEVMFTFKVHDEVYRFTRRLLKKTKNFHAEYDVSKMDTDGVFRTMFENAKEKEVTEKAEELIGLNKDQFRQVVLLPQGQFEKFLTADSSSKEEILSKIFGTDKWGQYVDAFYNRAYERKNELSAYKKKVEDSLREEGDYSSIEELKAVVDAIRVETEADKERYYKYDAEGKQKALEADKDLSHKFDTLHENVQGMINMEARAQEMDSFNERVTKAEKVEKFREYIENRNTAEREFKKRTRQWEDLDKKLEPAKSVVNECLKNKNECEAESPVNDLQIRIGKLDSKRSIYESIDRLRTEEATAKGQWQKDEKELKAAKSSLEQADEKVKAAYLWLNDKDQEAADARNRYYSGIYGEIAQELKEGEKCPVCGSIHHPEPAQKAEGSVTREQVDAAEEIRKDADNKLTNANNLKSNADENYKIAQKKERDSYGKYTEAKKALENSQNGMLEGIATVADLDSEITKCTKQIEAFNTKFKQLSKKYDDAVSSCTSIETNIKSALKEKDEAEAVMKEENEILFGELEKAGYSSVEEVTAMMLPLEEQKRINGVIVEYNTKLEATKKLITKLENELSEFVEPNKLEFEARQKEIDAVKAEYISKSTENRGKIKRLEEKIERLKETESLYKNKLDQAEADLKFAKQLRGDTGIGLKRYVLGIMFNQVISEANNMLKYVHNGRYQIARTNDKTSGNKKGLELIAHDNRKPLDRGRNVAMLSGGEKFLVSLALSIGMSSVAQHSGIQIEALFIDEGFGTLDDSSIGDAMDVLKCVRETNSMIGIISHVQLLESTIGKQIEVCKSDEGSYIRM